MKNYPSTFEYPVIIKQDGEFLTVFCPDLNSWTGLPMTHDPKEILELLVHVWKQNNKRISGFKNAGKNAPRPSRAKDLFDGKLPVKLNSSQTARFCGVSKDTIIRDAKKGLIAHEKTSGGHLRFTPEDVITYKKTREKAYNAKTRSDWVTIGRAAKHWGISLTAARERVDRLPDSFVKHTPGGHRRISSEAL